MDTEWLEDQFIEMVKEHGQSAQEKGTEYLVMSDEEATRARNDCYKQMFQGSDERTCQGSEDVW